MINGILCLVCSLSICFLFFKQNTAYGMRINDWSSDVCSSDLQTDPELRGGSLPRQPLAACSTVSSVNPSVRNVLLKLFQRRSEERRVGKESVRTCRSRW